MKIYFEKNKKSNICGKKRPWHAKRQPFPCFPPCRLEVPWAQRGKGECHLRPSLTRTMPGRQAGLRGERKEEYQVLYIPVFGVVYVPSGRMNFSANLPRKPRTYTVSGRQEKLVPN